MISIMQSGVPCHVTSSNQFTRGTIFRMAVPPPANPTHHHPHNYPTLPDNTIIPPSPPADSARRPYHSRGTKHRATPCAVTFIYLPSDPSRGRSSLLCVRTRLRVRWTVAADGGRSRTTDPDQHRMHRTRLHLTVADDGLRPAGLTAAAAALRALVHVQLTRLHGTAATSRGTAAPGTLYASPHPLHSTTGVRLAIGRPTPPSAHARSRSRGFTTALRSSPRDLGYARLVALRGMKPRTRRRRDARSAPPLPPSSRRDRSTTLRPSTWRCANKSGRLPRCFTIDSRGPRPRVAITSRFDIYVRITLPNWCLSLSLSDGKILAAF